jgi:hypothetical protein
LRDNRTWKKMSFRAHGQKMRWSLSVVSYL